MSATASLNSPYFRTLEDLTHKVKSFFMRLLRTIQT